jgi:hypothetical protein
MFLPGLLFALLMTLAALKLIKHIYPVPDVRFIATPWMLVSSF